MERIFTPLILMGLVSAGVAANEVQSTIDQQGENLSAVIDQNLSENSLAIIHQGLISSSGDLTAVITQTDVIDATAEIVQNGTTHTATITQVAGSSLVDALIDQAGSGNIAAVAQSGLLNSAEVNQLGIGGSVELSQNGGGNSATVLQNEESLNTLAVLNQTGNDNIFEVIQTGTDNTVEVDATGEANLVSINQGGTNNLIAVDQVDGATGNEVLISGADGGQFGEDNLMEVIQSGGVGNSATLYQSVNTSGSEIFVTQTGGSGNSAYVNQSSCTNCTAQIVQQ